MAEGIDHTNTVLIFLTQNFINKVNGKDHHDNCHLEFLYAARTKSRGRLVPVVMEPELRDCSLWTGVIGMYLRGKMYIDMSGDINNVVYLNERIDELCEMLQKLGVVPSKVPSNIRNVSDGCDDVDSRACDCCCIGQNHDRIPSSNLKGRHKSFKNENPPLSLSIPVLDEQDQHTEPGDNNFVVPATNTAVFSPYELLSPPDEDYFKRPDIQQENSAPNFTSSNHNNKTRTPKADEQPQAEVEETTSGSPIPSLSGLLEGIHSVSGMLSIEGVSQVINNCDTLYQGVRSDYISRAIVNIIDTGMSTADSISHYLYPSLESPQDDSLSGD